jgi:hypothetical protein
MRLDMINNPRLTSWYKYLLRTCVVRRDIHSLPTKSRALSSHLANIGDFFTERSRQINLIGPLAGLVKLRFRLGSNFALP